MRIDPAAGVDTRGVGVDGHATGPQRLGETMQQPVDAREVLENEITREVETALLGNRLGRCICRRQVRVGRDFSGRRQRQRGAPIGGTGCCEGRKRELGIDRREFVAQAAGRLAELAVDLSDGVAGVRQVSLDADDRLVSASAGGQGQAHRAARAMILTLHDCSQNPGRLASGRRKIKTKRPPEGGPRPRAARSKRLALLRCRYLPQSRGNSFAQAIVPRF